MTNPSEVMYHAQCPHCATIRKISLLQLKENKGLVPCRRCEQSYPARGHLLSLEQLEQLMSQASIKNQNPAEPEPITLQELSPVTSTAPTQDNNPPIVQNTTPKEVVMENVFVGVINEEESEPAKPTKSIGLFAKLLSRKNSKQNTESNDNNDADDIVFIGENSSNATDGFAASKAKLHADDAIISENNILDDFDTSNLDLSHTDSLASAKSSKTTTKKTTKPVVEEIFETNIIDEDDDAHIVAIDPQQSKIDTLLVREASEQPLATLKESDVLAPEYDANRQWFTQMFQTMQAHNTQLDMVKSETNDAQADSHEDLIQTAKRMNDAGNSNTVTMRLPENSMLVFTLEDNGTTQSMIELPRTEPQPQGQASVIHTVEVTNQQNEHTMWTVANIVAIVVLIIQMFYYFLLLTP